MRYRMIAIDLDGTLLDESGQVSRENLDAVAAAHAAGAMVVPCTGRAWRESKTALAGMADIGSGVFVTGAVVADLATGRSLDLAVMEPHLAAEIVDFLYDLPEAILVFREANLAGHDYLVTGNGELSANTRWWFQTCGSTVVYAHHPTVDDLRHTLRIAIVASRKRMQQVTDDLRERFSQRMFFHYFGSIGPPENGQPVYVLEMFATGVDKWRGLKWLAFNHGIDASQIAAIGDQINDLAMLANTGCGIAMGNAIEQVKAQSDYVTLDHDAAGVAHAIGQLLTGRWK